MGGQPQQVGPDAIPVLDRNEKDKFFLKTLKVLNARPGHRACIKELISNVELLSLVSHGATMPADELHNLFSTRFRERPGAIRIYGEGLQQQLILKPEGRQMAIQN